MQTILRTTTATGNTAMGWLHRAQGAPDTLIIILHGHNTWGDRSRYITLAKWLEHGTGAPHSACDVLRWNATRPVLAEKQWEVPTVSAEYEQVESLVMHARAQRPYKRVIAVGHSQGAMHALKLAAEGRVQGAVSIMGVGDTGASLERKRQAIGLAAHTLGHDRITTAHGETFVYTAAFFTDFSSWDMPRIAQHAKAPVLFFAGTTDTTISVHEVETLFAVASEPKSLILVEDEHRFSDETAKRIAQDIQDWMGPA